MALTDEQNVLTPDSTQVDSFTYNINPLETDSTQEAVVTEKANDLVLVSPTGEEPTKPIAGPKEEGKEDEVIEAAEVPKSPAYEALNDTDKSRFDRIKELTPVVKKISKDTGLNPAFILSQILQESGYGQSGLTKEDNNFGGIKADATQGVEGQDWNRWTTNEEFKGPGALQKAKAYLAKEERLGFKGVGNTTDSKHGTFRNSMQILEDGTVRVRLEQPFKKFGSLEEGLQGQFDFYKNNPRYGKQGIYDTNDPYEQLKAAKAAGYATDTDYESKVGGIIDSLIKPGGKFYGAYDPTPQINFDNVQEQLTFQSQFDQSPSVLALGDTPQGRMMGKSKYDENLTLPAFLDIEETRGQRQTNGDKFANGIVKFAGKTGTNVVGGIAGTVYGLGSAIANFDKAKFFDNDFARMLDDTNEWMDGKLPHYYTQAETEEESLLNKVTSANFIFDSALNGFSFLAGAVLTEMAATALTGGLGAGLAAANIVSRAGRLLKRFDRGKRMANIIKGTKAVGRQKAGWDALKIGRQLLTGASYESGIEARASYDQILAGLKNDWHVNNPNMDMPEDVENTFIAEARNSANGVFLGNMALVGGSNLIMLNKLYGPGIALRQTANKQIQRVLPSFGRKVGKDVTGKAIGKYSSLGKAANFVGIGAKTQKTIGKITGRTKSMLGTAFYEGFVEEGGQSVLGSAAYDYSMMRASSESTEVQADLISSLTYAFTDTYKGTEGQSEIALGAALSIVGFGKGSGVRGRYKDRVATEGLQDKIAEQYNKHEMLRSLKNTSKFMHESHKLARLMDEAEANRNIAEYKNLENDEYFGYVKSRYNAGYFEDIAEDAEAVRDMSNDQFIEAFGYDRGDFKNESEISARKNKAADSAVERAELIKSGLELADRALGSQANDDDERRYTDEQYIKVRDALAYNIATAELSDARATALKEKLATLSNGKLISVTAEDSENLVLQDIDPETGEVIDKTIKLSEFTQQTLPVEGKRIAEQMDALNEKLESDSKLGEDDPAKMSDAQREVLETRLERLEGHYKFLEDMNASGQAFLSKDFSEITPEEFGLIQNIVQELEELQKDDPIAYEKNVDEIIETVKDLRHLRARRQNALAQFNALFTEEGVESHLQEIERYVDTENKQEALKRMRDDAVPENFQKLFELYGPNADLHFARPSNIAGYEAFPHITNEKGEYETQQGKDFILRFDDNGKLYSIDENLLVEFTNVEAVPVLDPVTKLPTGATITMGTLRLVNKETEKTVATNLTLSKVVTDAQKDAIESIAAIERAKENKKSEITKLKKEIADAETSVLEAIESMQPEDIRKEGLQYRDMRTGRFVSGAQQAWANARDIIETGAELVQLYEQEIADLENQSDYLADLVGVYYNPRTREFDTDLADLYLNTQADRKNTLEDIAADTENLVKYGAYFADRGVMEDRNKAKEFAQLFKGDLDTYIEELQVQTDILKEDLERLGEYKDILESTLLQRLKELKLPKALPLNKYEAANTLNELYADIVNVIGTYISEEEFIEDKVGVSRDQSEVATMRTKFETLLELEDYTAYRNFMKKNPGFFYELRNFLGDLDSVEEAMYDIRFLRAELTRTKEQIADTNNQIESIKKEQAVKETERDKADVVLDTIEFEERYEDIMGAFTQIQTELLNKIAAEEAVEKEGVDKTNPSQSKHDLKAGHGPISDLAHEFEKEYETRDYSGKGLIFRPDIEVGFKKTQGNLAANEYIQRELGDYADGKWSPKEGLTVEESKAFKNAQAGVRFFKFTSSPFKYNEHFLVPVHSKNVPEKLKKELGDAFYEDEHTVDGAHILLVVHKKVNGKLQPVYEDTKTKTGLTYSSLALPTRTTEIDGKEHPRFRNTLSSQEAYDESLDYAVESLRTEREDILAGVPYQYKVTGTSVGVPRISPGSRVSIEKNIIGRDSGLDAGGRIVIATNVVDPITGDAEINYDGKTFKVRAGFAYYKFNGNLYPLKMRNLNDLEVDNVIKLLRRRENAIDVFANTGSTRTEAVKEAEATLKEEGVTSTISELISNYIYEGKPKKAISPLTERFQFYFDKKRGGYVYGEAGFIKSSDLVNNNTAEIDKLRTFLNNKTHQINNKLLSKDTNYSLKKKKPAEKTKIAANRKFEEVVLDENLNVDTDASKLGKDKHATYERYLLEDRSTGTGPVLGTAVRSSIEGPLTKFKYMTFQTVSESQTQTPTRDEPALPNFDDFGFDLSDDVDPDSTKGGSLQDGAAFIRNIKNNQKISIEDPMFGGIVSVDPKLVHINEAFGFDPPGASGMGTRAPWSTKEEAITYLEQKLEEYSKADYKIAVLQAPGMPVKLKIATFEDFVGRDLGEVDIVTENDVLEDSAAVKVEAKQESNTPAAPPAEEGVGLEELIAKSSEEADDAIDNAVFKLVNLNEAQHIKATPEQVAKEEAELAKMYPNMDVKRVAGFIKTKDGYAQGRVAKFGEVLLSEMAEYGTGYHEAFHQTSLFMLDEAERNQMYSEVRKNTGEVITFQGNQKAFSELTDREAEEYLAEEFRTWVLTNGKHKVGSTKIKSIFQKIADVLKMLLGKINLLSDDVDPNFEKTLEIFNNIRQGSYATATPKRDTLEEPYNKLANIPSHTIGNLGALQTTALVRSFHREFIDALIFDTDSPYTLADLERLSDPAFKLEYSKKTNQIYRKALKKAVAKLAGIADRTTNKETARTSIKVRNQLLNNIPALVNLHREYLTSLGAGLELNYEELAENEYARVKDSASSMVDAMEISTKENARRAIKVLISSLPAGRVNESTLEDTVNYAEAMDFLQETLAGTQDFKTQVERLQRNIAKKPWLAPLLERIKATGDLNMSSFEYTDVKLQNMFFQQFAKTKNDFLMYMVNDDGEIYAVDTNKQRLNRSIVAPWKAALINDLGKKGSVVIQSKESGNVIIDINAKANFGYGEPISINEINKHRKTKGLPKGAKAILFLERLGITFSNPTKMLSTEVTEGMDAPNIDILNETTTWIIKELIAKSFGEGVGADLFDSENVDAQTRLGKLMKIEASHNDLVTELQHFNPEGKVVYGITLNTYLSLVANATDLDTYLNPDINMYSKNSEWLRELREGGEMQIVVLEGMKIDGYGERGVKTAKLTGADQRAMDINATLQGVSPFLRAADQGVEYGIRVPGEVVKNIEDVGDRLLGYLEDEIATAANLNKNGEGSQFKRYRDKGKSLRIFKNIMSSGSTTLKADLEMAVQGSMTIKDFMTKHGTQSLGLIDAHISNQSRENLKLFKTYRLVDPKGNGTYEFNGVSIQTVQSLLNTKDTTFGESAIQRVADMFTLNDFMNSIEQTKIFMGDPSFYKAFFKRTKGAVGTGKIARVDPMLDAWLNRDEGPSREDGKDADGKEAVMVYQDPIARSAMYEEYSNYIGEDAAPYLNIEEADAQGYATLGAYRELLVRVGDWTDLQESLYEDAINGRQLSSNELANFPIIKPQYFGPQVTNGMHAPFFMKFSLAPLFPQMLERANTLMVAGDPTLLKGLYDSMIENQVGITMFQSGVKVGAKVNSVTGKASPFYSKDGIINPINADNVSTIDYKYFKIQLDISPKVKDKNTAGTQERSIVFSNMMDGGVPIDFMRKEIDHDKKLIKWNALSEREKVKKSTKYALYTEHSNLLNAFTKNAKAKLLKQFDVVEHKDGTYSLKDNDFTKFGEILQKELASRNLPRNLANSVQFILDNQGEGVLFDLMVNKDRFESILFSLVANRVTRHKFKGDMKVQMSASGMEVEARTMYQHGDEYLAMSGSEEFGELQMYRKADPNNPGSKTLGMEVLMPHFFKEYLGQDLEIRKDGIYDSKGVKIGDSSLLDLIGFRIPTEDVYSIDFIRIKGFLPKAMGSAVVIPSELVVKAGGDFDIDKLTLYIPTYRKKKGVFQKTELLKGGSKPDGTATSAALLKYYDDRYKGILNFAESLEKRIEQVKQEVDEETAVANFINVVFGMDLSEELYTLAELEVLNEMLNTSEDLPNEVKEAILLNEYAKLKEKIKNIPSFAEFEIENADKTPMDLESSGAIQNRIMEIQKQILESPDNYEALITPLTLKGIKDNALAIRKLKGEAAENSDLPFDEMFSFKTRAQLKEDFWSARVGTGIAARNVTHHIKSQIANLFVKENTTVEHFGEKYLVKLNFEGFEQSSLGGAISLSRTLDAAGNKISKTLSQFVSGFIDVVNDPYIFTLNANPVTADAWFFLIRSGVPLRSISRFMNQPIIQNLLDNMTINRSKFLTAAGKEMSIVDVFNATRTSYALKRSTEKVESRQAAKRSKDVLLSDDVLESMIPLAQGEGMTNDQIDLQLQILQDFRMYSGIGGELNSAVSATAQDTTNPKNRHEARIFNAEFDYVQAKGIFGNFDKLFDNSFMKEFQNVSYSSLEYFKDLFLTEDGKATAMGELDRLREVFTNPELRVSLMDRVRGLREADNDFITMLLQTIEVDNKLLIGRATELMQGKNSLPSRIKKLQAKGYTNPWIKAFVPILSMERSGPLANTDGLQLIMQNLDVYTQDMLLDAFEELRLVARGLSDDILDFAILQSGMSQSTISFTSLLPATLIAERAMQIFKVYNNTNGHHGKGFFDKFFRNNWNNPAIVPVVKKNKANLPSVSEHSNAGKFPYVTLLVNAVSPKEALELKKQGRKIPKEKVLFKRLDLGEPYGDSGVRFWKYGRAEKFGNGRFFKEYRQLGETSMLTSNRVDAASLAEVKGIRNTRIGITLPKTLSDFMTKAIVDKRKTTLSFPEKDTIESHTYKIEGATIDMSLLRGALKMKDLNTLEKKTIFASKEGFSSWDKLVTAIEKGYSTIPKSWLSGKSSIKVFDIKNVKKDVNGIVSNWKEGAKNRVAFTGPRLKGLDGSNLKGEVYQEVARQMEELVEDLILDGKSEFIVGGAEGVDIMAAKTILALQKKHTHIKLHTVIPFPGYENAIENKDDRVWLTKRIYQRKGELINGRNTLTFTEKKAPKIRRDAYFARNNYMIEGAETVIAVFGKGQQGGTGHAVGQATKKGKSIEQIDLAEIKEAIEIMKKDEQQSKTCNS